MPGCSGTKHDMYLLVHVWRWLFGKAAAVMDIPSWNSLQKNAEHEQEAFSRFIEKTLMCQIKKRQVQLCK